MKCWFVASVASWLCWFKGRCGPSSVYEFWTKPIQKLTFKTSWQNSRHRKDMPCFSDVLVDWALKQCIQPDAGRHCFHIFMSWSWGNRCFAKIGTKSPTIWWIWWLGLVGLVVAALSAWLAWWPPRILLVLFHTKSPKEYDEMSNPNA